jgi:ribose/xylose/arabinose/galactoside ABC-type transport system permease subunit
MQELGLLIVILVMGTGLSIYGAADAAPGRENTFLNLPNLVDQIATNMSYYAIMAVGMTLVIVTGGIDISVGSTMAASALAGAWVLQHFPREAPAPEVLALGIGVPLAVGFACGLLNGSLVVAGLHPFIVTLGTMSIIRGLAIVAPPMKTLPTAGHRLPEAFTTHFAQLKLREFDSMRKIAGWIDRCIPVERLQQFLHGVGELRMMPMIIMLVVTAIGWFYLSQTIGGREIYAVGGNEEAARFSGVRTNRVKLRVYVLAGITAGIAGMVSLGRFGSASSNTANGYELTVVAAAVVGGASLSGGRGSAIGALLGALLIAMIENGIDTLHWNSEYRKVIIGAAIIIAVAIDQLSSYLRARRLRGSRT